MKNERADELRRFIATAQAELDAMASSGCTGVSARWCPTCGDCECSYEDDFNDEGCPLHSSWSPHAEAIVAACFNGESS